jgi:hydrogenase maturation protease
LDRAAKPVGKEKRPATLIIGLGNTILSDDGVGIYILRDLAQRTRDPQVEFQEASLGGLELLDMIQGRERVILIDAIMTGKVPVGHLLELKVEDLSGGSAMARHQISFSEALQLGERLHMDLPGQIQIFAVEVQDPLTFGETCTPELVRRIPELVDAIYRKVFPDTGKLNEDTDR